MQLLFFLFALVAVIGALGMVLSRNIVHSALFLVLSFIGLALIYFALQAPFLGAVQLMVYSGAVAILIVMAIMMVGRADMSISAPVQSLVKRFVGAGMAALVLSTARSRHRPHAAAGDLCCPCNRGGGPCRAAAQQLRAAI